MTQETAVWWLAEQLFKDAAPTLRQRALIEQAKEMEKEQHQETFKQSRQAKIFEEGMPPVWESFEQYYKETYGKTNDSGRPIL